MSGSYTVLAWDTASNRTKRTTTPVPNTRSGREVVAQDDTSVAVTFSSVMPNTNYSVICVWQNTADSSPQFQPIVVTTLSTSGFIATWNAPTDSAHYSINWLVTSFV